MSAGASSGSTAQSPAEELHRAAVTGHPVRRGDGGTADAGPAWTADRQIPASAIYDLLVRPGERLRAIVLIGLRITGRLNLEAIEWSVPLIAHKCYFDAPINLAGATASRILLSECLIPGITADQLHVRGDVDLSYTRTQILSLFDTRVDGRLILNGVHLTGAAWPIDHEDGMLQPSESFGGGLERVALIGDDLSVGSGMICRGLRAGGPVRLHGARIGSQLSLTSAVLQEGFRADGARVDGAMDCNGTFRAEGLVSAIGAHVEGQWTLKGATLNGGLSGDGLHVADMFCTEGFSAGKDVRLVGAHIGGTLSFEGATLSGGLIGEGLQIDEMLHCRDGFRAEGPVRISGAHIASVVDFDGATLVGGLSADALQVDGSMVCRNGFRSEQPVSLIAASGGAAAVLRWGDTPCRTERRRFASRRRDVLY